LAAETHRPLLFSLGRSDYLPGLLSRRTIGRDSRALRDLLHWFVERTEENVMATLENLEQRLAALEREVAEVKACLYRVTASQPSGEESRGARMIREAEEGHAELVAASERVMKQLGIKGEPIGIKELRERMIAAGHDPNDNAFSRELIAMRDE
jgi:hypothetical protein